MAMDYDLEIFLKLILSFLFSEVLLILTMVFHQADETM